jgi:hypothetical protein
MTLNDRFSLNNLILTRILYSLTTIGSNQLKKEELRRVKTREVLKKVSNTGSAPETCFLQRKKINRTLKI